jgi:hypothetical protein
LEHLFEFTAPKFAGKDYKAYICKNVEIKNYRGGRFRRYSLLRG